jgi:hypothetical protein
MDHRLRIGLDVDGVLYPFVPVVRAWLLERGWVGAEHGPVTQWAFYRDWGLTDEQWRTEWAAGIRAGVIFGPAELPEEDRAAVASLLAGGDEVHLVTSRNVPGVEAEARALTWRWVAELGLPFTSVSISSDKGCVDTDLFLEDSPANCLVLAEETDSMPVLLARPYNVAAQGELWCVGSIAEFVAVVDTARHELAGDGPSGVRCERCGERWPLELVAAGVLGGCWPDAEDGEELGVELWAAEGDDFDPSGE